MLGTQGGAESALSGEQIRQVVGDRRNHGFVARLARLLEPLQINVDRLIELANRGVGEPEVPQVHG